MNDRIAKTTMLINQPIEEVFDAFVRPEKITRFWLESTSAPLARDAKANWRFMVPGASETVAVTAFEPPRLIAFDWSDGKHVDLTFDIFKPRVTHITAEVSGFDAKAGIADIVNATEGFTIVLCDLKTMMESGRSANLVRDKAELISSSRSETA
ncbi:MAG TPA: SRPBCC domain-containing protein [Steroidobacteraceae bacterium]|nr:SRPBCC domain-containing protein [Steroidobacteraceae bacterium]